MALKTFISGISPRLGKSVDLSELKQDGVPDEAIANLRRHGFQRFLRETRGPADVWSECASTSLDKTGLKPEAIDLILIATSSPSIAVGLRTLQLAGMGRSTLLGLSLQDCCAGVAAVHIASELVLNGDGDRRVLAIVPWASCASDRLTRNLNILFSDGTIAFVVSNQEGDFQILASECSTDPNLADLENSWQRAPYLLASLSHLQEIANRTLQKAGINSNELRAVFCTNGNSVFQDAIGMGTSTRGLIYKDTFARFGHIPACDELIGLKVYVDEQTTTDGDLFLLLSWAPYSAAACVLKRAGQR
jgi:3-oxoacyl-[acyl-carrier-protein] synthase III